MQSKNHHNNFSGLIQIKNTTGVTLPTRSVVSLGSAGTVAGTTYLEADYVTNSNIDTQPHVFTLDKEIPNNGYGFAVIPEYPAIVRHANSTGSSIVAGDIVGPSDSSLFLTGTGSGYVVHEVNSDATLVRVMKIASCACPYFWHLELFPGAGGMPTSGTFLAEFTVDEVGSFSTFTVSVGYNDTAATIETAFEAALLSATGISATIVEFSGGPINESAIVIKNINVSGQRITVLGWTTNSLDNGGQPYVRGWVPA